MSVSTVVTRGFGLAVGTAFIPTLGFGSGEVVEPPPAPVEPHVFGAYHVDPIKPWKGWPALPPPPARVPEPPPDPRMKDPVYARNYKNLEKARAAIAEKKVMAANAETERNNALRLAQIAQREAAKRAHLDDRMLTIAAKQELLKRAKRRWTRGD
jgi:hypothetical protein